MFADMQGAVCREASGYYADGEDGYFLSCAEKQFSERPRLPLEVQFQDVREGLPLGLLRLA